MNSTEQFQSEHFNLVEVSSGIYAAIDNENGTAFGNAGIINMGNGSLVFDTCITPAAGRDLRDAAEQLTGQPVRWVINSHFHNDHIRGNQAFAADTPIIRTVQTRELIATAGVEQLRSDQDNALGLMQQFQAQYDSSDDPAVHARLDPIINFYRGIAASLPEIRLRLPDITFEDRLVIDGSVRRAEVLSYGGGHTGNDAFLLLPDDGIAFLSDLLFIEFHPLLANGDPDALLRYLDRLLALDVQQVVPGHGPVGTLEDVQTLCGYLQTVMALTSSLVEAGKSADEIAAMPVPEAYANWSFPNFFAASMRFLHEWFTSK